MTQENFIKGDFEYKVKNGQVTIVGLNFFRRKYYTCVTIPQFLDSYPVTRIDTAGLGGWRGLRKIIIPHSITHITNGAFSVYKNLRLVFQKDHLVYKFIDGALFDKRTNTLCAYLGAKNHRRI